jgi:hypothetical protein
MAPVLVVGSGEQCLFGDVVVVGAFGDAANAVEWCLANIWVL